MCGRGQDTAVCLWPSCRWQGLNLPRRGTGRCIAAPDSVSVASFGSSKSQFIPCPAEETVSGALKGFTWLFAWLVWLGQGGREAPAGIWGAGSFGLFPDLRRGRKLDVITTPLPPLLHGRPPEAPARSVFLFHCVLYTVAPFPTPVPLPRSHATLAWFSQDVGRYFARMSFQHPSVRSGPQVPLAWCF